MLSTNIINSTVLSNLQDGRNGFRVITEADSGSFPLQVNNIIAMAIIAGAQPNKIATIDLVNVDGARTDSTDIVGLTTSNGVFNLSLKSVTVTAIEVGGPAVLLVLGENG